MSKRLLIIVFFIFFGVKLGVALIIPKVYFAEILKQDRVLLRHLQAIPLAILVQWKTT